MTVKLTNAEKRALATCLIIAAGDMLARNPSSR